MATRYWSVAPAKRCATPSRPTRRSVAATGVLTPVCGSSPSGTIFRVLPDLRICPQFPFALRLVQVRCAAAGLWRLRGDFAARRVLAVGGFDPACIVEDYELIHRLRRHGALADLGWTTSVVGGARAVTDAPSTLPAFLASGGGDGFAASPPDAALVSRHGRQRRATAGSAS